MGNNPTGQGGGAGGGGSRKGSKRLNAASLNPIDLFASPKEQSDFELTQVMLAPWWPTTYMSRLPRELLLNVCLRILPSLPL